jgi:hypothetical protein
MTGTGKVLRRAAATLFAKINPPERSFHARPLRRNPRGCGHSRCRDLQTGSSFDGKTVLRIVFQSSKLPKRSASTDAGASLARIARPNPGCHRRLPTTMDQHGRALFRMSLRTDRAMKTAYHRGLWVRPGGDGQVQIRSIASRIGSGD